MEPENQNTLAAAYLESVRKRFEEYKTLGDKTLAQLSGDQLHFRPNTSSNSIAIIMQHMHGNMMSRWTNLLTDDGEKPWRNRDAEFEEQELSKDELLQLWHEGWSLVLNTIASLTEQDLLKMITIRQQPLTVIDAINRQLVHYSGHIGQIILFGKWLLSDKWQSFPFQKSKVHPCHDT